MTEISRVAVLGAGLMGTQIAALLANAGFDVDLLDLAVDGDPAGGAKAGLARAEGARPAVFFLPEIARRVRVGSFDDLSCLGRADWVIEAVVEELPPQSALLARVSRMICETCVISSNTSGLSIDRLCQVLPAKLRGRFLGIHFFNPVRQMRLVEVIPSSRTDPAVLTLMTSLIEKRLGKSVVACRDTPNFIANRLGVFALMDVLQRMADDDWAFSVEAVDAVTGPLLGRPVSATLRLCDLIGLDTLVKVANTAHDNLIGEQQRHTFKAPAFVEGMLEAGLIGAKAGGGFYRKTDSGIEALDLARLEYRRLDRPDLCALTEVAANRDLALRLQGVYESGQDRLSLFVRDHLNAVLVYAAEHAESMATQLRHVDLAMQWGFNWELGPFEIIDAIGLSNWIGGLEQAGFGGVPPLVAEMNRDGGCAYATRERTDSGQGSERIVYSLARRRYEPLPPSNDDDELVAGGTVRWHNEGGRVLDFDGVGMVLFSSKLNVIGTAALEIVHRALDAEFRALVIGGTGGNFSAGADLHHMMGLIDRDDWQGLVAYLDRFQEAIMGLRHAPIPVVAAPRGLALGGGCEFCLASDLRVPAAELRMGLVETSVGIIPGAGGCVEMARRFGSGSEIGDAFDLVFAGRFSDNALQARAWGLLESGDEVQMSSERILRPALAMADDMAQAGYRPPNPDPFTVAGDSAFDMIDARLAEKRAAGELSEHDQLVGRLLAGVLCGGRGRQMSTEQELLELEREAFLELCHTAPTHERMAHMLKTGKPLRN